MSVRREIRVSASGRGIGAWMLEHQGDDLTEAGFCVVGGSPRYTVPVSESGKGWPEFARLEGDVDLLLVGAGEFENNLEAVQVAVERVAHLPDAARFDAVSLRVEVEVRP